MKRDHNGNPIKNVTFEELMEELMEDNIWRNGRAYGKKVKFSNKFGNFV